jgi:hypothetical protein
VAVIDEYYEVVIATPGRMMHAEYVQSLTETISYLARQGIRVKYLNKYSSFIPTARELTASDTWSHDYSSNKIAGGSFLYNKIFWIDSDIEWTVEDFMKLYDSDLDVVSGLYALDPYGKVAVGYPNNHGVPTSVSKVEFMLHENPVEVGGVGFGFVCMKSGVFESIPRPWFLIGRVQWSPDSDMRVNVGEDYSWCGKAQQAGYKIYVDPTVKVRHHKETVYEV